MKTVGAVMAEHSLVINFSPAADTLIDPYWLRMELVEPDDGQMTVGEAAAFIDALYDTSICGQTTSEAETEEQPDGTDWDRAFALMRLPMCDNLAAADDGDPGAYDTQIKVYRSHQKELYKMILTNGTLGAPRRIEERVTLTLDIEDRSSITLDMPIYKRPFIAWQDIDGPDINVKGNTLWWEGVVTGVLRAEFTTIYDLVNVHVHGIANMGSDVITGTNDGLGTGWYSGSEDGSELTDVNDIECTALAFYHYQYEELILHKPEVDESVTEEQAVALCRYAGSTHVKNSPGFGDPRYDEAACKADCARWHVNDADALAACNEKCERECFKRVRTTEICTCGGDETEVVNDVPVPCPPGYNTGSVVNGGAVEAGGDSFVSCGPPDVVHDPAYYEQKCCFPPDDDLTLPECEEKHEVYTGQEPTEQQIADIRAAHGDNANIIPVGPGNGVCGEIITTQNVVQKGCCDGVVTINWDNDNSDDDMPGIIAITGGSAPFYWSIRGDGFTFAGGGRDIVTQNPAVEVVSSIECRNAKLTVTDLCSTKSKTVIHPASDPFRLSPEDEGDLYMDTNSYRTLNVLGGIGPFTWVISGIGYLFHPGSTHDTEITSAPVNSIYAWGPCGYGYMRVTDSCGTSVEFTVFSRFGHWVVISTEGTLSGPTTNCYDYPITEGVIDYGTLRIKEYRCGNGSWPCNGNELGDVQCGPYADLPYVLGRKIEEWQCY